MDSSIELDNIIVCTNRVHECFKIGRSKNDEHYYTDMVYRCNQAFEDYSRLSYKLLAQWSVANLSPSQPIIPDVWP